MKSTLYLLVSALNVMAQVPIPVSSLWKSEPFRNEFTASYGVDAAVEPRISAEEKQVLDSIAGKMRDENRKGAIAKLEESIWLAKSAALQFTLANLLVEENRAADAIPYFEKAIELYPSFRDAHRNLALALIQENQIDAAMKPLIRAIELRASDGLTYGLLAYCHSESGRFSSALQAYRQAQLLMPDEWQWKLGEANALLMLGEYASAAELFGELLEQQPKNEQLWLAQADAYLADGRTERAIANREVVRRMGRLPPDGLLVLGHLYLNIDLPDSAIDCYISALSGIELPDALEALDRLITSRHWKQAEILLSEISTEDPAVKRAEAFIQVQTGELLTGIRILETIVADDPMDAEALLMLGKAYRRTDQLEKSALVLEQAARSKSAKPEALLLLGQVLTEQEQYEQAILVLERANRLQPNPSVAEYIAAIQNLLQHP
ncbi:tetratricopeptide repeat protein [Verrucomicrobia bacterium S94]|nr:tetratricopeptide repeat protein [Verrucomicrobia bacterium S94]